MAEPVPTGTAGTEEAWRPGASVATLRRRADLLQAIRAYFARTASTEVDTPLLDCHATTDPALASFAVREPDGRARYLQTSPEFAMKRLLAAGAGDIHQICHAFRREEGSRLHQEEFTLLEWYRVGFDHHALMTDVEHLLAAVGFPYPVQREAYAALCRRHTGLDPHTAATPVLADFARAQGAVLDAAGERDRALLLDWIYGCAMLPQLPRDSAVLVYDFPLEQAAYARVRPGPPAVAERFELVVGEVELANGFHEVTVAAEQRERHARENARRAALGLPAMAVDERLLAALAAGLPACAGVALGIDRLLMLLVGATDLTEVIAFASPAPR